MSEAFGARLRTQRERQRIELRTIADETKIKISLLDGLERGDVSHWPGGIFRRAFVRAYAQKIGLDPDAIVREFLDLFPDPGEDFTLSTLVASEEPSRMARLRAAVGATFRSRPAEPRVSEPAPAQAPVGAARRDEPIEPAPAAIPDVPLEEPYVPLQQAEHADLDAPGAPEPVAIDAEPAAAAIVLEAAEPETIGPPAMAALDPDLSAIASICTALAQVDDPGEMPSILSRIGDALDACGLIVWLWDPDARALRPSLGHGYSPTVLFQIPAVDRDADNATAAAFRMRQTCSVGGSERANGALAVPLVGAAGCGGVLAVELRHPREWSPGTRAAAEIFAAQIAAMVHVAESAVSADRELMRSAG